MRNSFDTGRLILVSIKGNRYKRLVSAPWNVGVAVIFLSLGCFGAFAQTSLNRYVCPSEETTVIQAENLEVPQNPHQMLCGDTWITGEVIPDAEYNLNPYGYPFTSISGAKVATEAGTRPQITLNWKPEWRGTVQVAIFFNFKFADDIFDVIKGDCDHTKIKMITYTVTRDVVNPGGTLQATAVIESVDGNAAIDLNYIQGETRYIGDIIAMQLLLNENVVGETTNSTTITHQATNFGVYNFKVKVTDRCNEVHDGPSATVRVAPTCYNDDPSLSKLNISGEGMYPVDGGWLRLQKDQTYTITVEGMSDFDSHYILKHDGGEDIRLSMKEFQVLKPIGSYRIEAARKDNRSECPSPPPIDIFVGGNNEMIPEDGSSCPIILPDHFAKFGFPDIVIGDIVLQHFAAIVKSQRSVTVKPGITLTMGAELILDLVPAEPEPGDPDLNMNFIQTLAYDDYGRLLGESRSYFDGGGKNLQSQSKNLTSGVMLASQTINDAYGRPVVVTLSAPVSVSTKQNIINVCNETEQVGKDLAFKYKPDFVTATDGSVYDHEKFDLLKETSPEPVGNSEPGTLGWYYSANNGTATGDLAKMNEPLTPSTAYPYSRTLYHRDGSGEAKGSTRPGDAFHAGSGHVSSIVNEEVYPGDEYLADYFKMRADELKFPAPSSEAIRGEFFRTVAIDENKNKAISYTDKSGAVIINLYFGKQASAITRSYQFYDNAGRVLVSVTPNGLEQYNGANFASIDKTTYEYNYKGWLLKMTEPDAGTTEYVYRKDGKIRFSQNAEQKKNGSFSYTNYDRSGRPLESGEYKGTKTFNGGLGDILETLGYEGGLTGGKKSFWIRTYYDEPAATLAQESGDETLNIPVKRVQRFVSGAVSITGNENVTTWYSYDERSRVEWIIQKIHNASTEAFSVKTVDYRYGPTGAVEEVLYQTDQPDQFSHYYEYDKDGRLFKVFTSRNKLVYNKLGELTNPEILALQATYFHYLHGPLKRVELEDKLQGIDYVYTADGALKAINHHDPAKDPAQDGTANDFKPDVFGMTLDYYSQDYASAGYNETGLNLTDYDDQYSGIIKAMRWHGPVEPGTPHAYAYKYDERYQLKEANWAAVSNDRLVFNTVPNAYREFIGGYDKNGNISALERHDNLGTHIADFTYQYETHSNELKAISNDGEVIRNYDYDEIGRMTYEKKDDKESFITYDVSGKVTGVYKAKDGNGNLTSPLVKYGYDDRGFRLYKETYKSDNSGIEKTTWYVRDASGNIAATYEEIPGQEPSMVEVPVYGSGRIGMHKPAYGQNFYEVTDHLGNVRAVIAGALQTTIMASMESERAEKENQDFFGMRTTVTATDINHTASTVTVEGETDVVDPNEVMRLNNRPNGKYNPNPIGGGTMIWIHPGDTVRAEVYAKYARLEKMKNKKDLMAFASMVKHLSPIANATELRKAFSILSQSDFRALPVWGKLDDAQPPAFLNGLMFDKDMKLQQFDFDQVSDKASIKPTDVKTDHEKLELEFVAEKEGFLYIYISNESKENVDVYFDDLKVTHVYGEVVSGGDFYPYGLEISDRQITRDDYRFGYQGQFAEKDEETGWNHFELREYDPVIGRWLRKDPAGQYYSPYVGMGNNPVSRTDPDGGFDEYDVMPDGTKVWRSDKGGSDIDYLNYYQRDGVNGSLYYTGTTAEAKTANGFFDLGSFFRNYYYGTTITVDRFLFTNNSTTSTFAINDEPTGYFLEPAWDANLAQTEGSDRAIMPGTYNLIQHQSLERNGACHYEIGEALRLIDVPGRVGVLIHVGNYPGDTSGCLLPGCSIGTDQIGAGTSRQTFNQVWNSVSTNPYGGRIIISNGN